MIVSKIVDLMISCFDSGDNFAIFLSLPYSFQKTGFSKKSVFFRFLVKETRFLSPNGA
ncbi:MAG: hypothetical protein ACKPH6_09110 [Microcystis panniformis]